MWAEKNRGGENTSRAAGEEGTSAAEDLELKARKGKRKSVLKELYKPEAKSRPEGQEEEKNNTVCL